MNAREHSDPDGDALTVTTRGTQTWITCTSGGQEVTVGPLPTDKITGALPADPMDGGVTAALIEKEAEKPDPSVDYHAMWWKAEREREKAERERGEAIAFMAEAQEEATRQVVRADTAESRPLTSDVITDEARDRAYRAVAALSVCDWDDMAGVAKGRAMAVVEAVIAEITRPEPPARPEGAEDVAVRLFQAGAAVGVEMTAEQRDALADHLAAMHVRVVGEDGAA